jgi:hypothetical protein
MREACCALIATAMLAPSGYGTAGFADDNTAFSLAISILRGAGGRHARALRIEADVNGVEIEAQDARHHNHINRCRSSLTTGKRALQSRIRRKAASRRPSNFPRTA